MSRPIANPVVHLELRTPNPRRACFFYSELFEWSVECVEAGTRRYLALEIADGLQGGVVAHDGTTAGWLPYVEVPEIVAATERGQRLGAEVKLEPREGPAGWRSVLAVPAGGEVALWQPKT
jgi:predicted enzyme related to lactoylglutathione lyase